jgi:hypothetical protein
MEDAMFKSIRVAPLGALATAALFSFGPQAASALEFEYIGQQNGKASVNFVRAKPPGDKVVDLAGVPAGAFTFKDVTSGPTMDTFLAWCFDVDTTLTRGTHSYMENSGLLNSTPPYLAGAGERIQKLFDKSYDESLFVANTADGNAASAGFQLAIWEVLYDDNFDIWSGSFLADRGSSTSPTAAEAAAVDFLKGVATYAGPQKWTITTYDSATKQDLGVATAVPLPAAAWLLLGVTGGLFAAKRRRARCA